MCRRRTAALGEWPDGIAVTRDQNQPLRNWRQRSVGEAAWFVKIFGLPVQTWGSFKQRGKTSKLQIWRYGSPTAKGRMWADPLVRGNIQSEYPMMPPWEWGRSPSEWKSPPKERKIPSLQVLVSYWKSLSLCGKPMKIHSPCLRCLHRLLVSLW